LLRQFHFLIAGEPGRCAMQISGEPILAQHEEESQRLDFFLILPLHNLAQMRTAHLP
jgi:hypothetical protein